MMKRPKPSSEGGVSTPSASASLGWMSSDLRDLRV